MEDKDIEDFFEKLGYNVSWDISQRLGEIWWEIYEKDELICQIDKGVDLKYIIEDFKCWHEGKDGTSSIDYKVNIENPNKFNNKFKQLLEKVFNYE